MLIALAKEGAGPTPTTVAGSVKEIAELSPPLFVAVTVPVQ